MGRFQSIADVHAFASSIMQLAADRNDETVRLILHNALQKASSSSPTEVLGETLFGLSAALEVMGDDYPSDIVAGAREVLEVGWEAIRKANKGLQSGHVLTVLELLRREGIAEPD